MHRLATATAALALVAGVTTPARAADANGSIGFLSHRAIYELKLDASSPRKQVSAVTGRMVYEFVGSPCDGWTTQFRFVAQMTDADDGNARVSDLRTSTYEDADGKLFDFLNQTYINQAVTDDSKGTARRDGADVAIALDRPAKKDLRIEGGALFPTQHLSKVVSLARAGERVFEARVYDGSETGERVFSATAIIGTEQTGADAVGDETAADVPELAKQRRWPVTVSYFDNKKKGGEDTPDYQISFVLYENGVTRKLTLDYGDLAISARLSKFEPLPQPACKQ